MPGIRKVLGRLAASGDLSLWRLESKCLDDSRISVVLAVAAVGDDGAGPGTVVRLAHGEPNGLNGRAKKVIKFRFGAK